METVHAVGKFGPEPFLVKDDRVYGPGVYDMKGGDVIALFVLHHTVFVFLEIGKCLFRSFIQKHSPFLMFYKVIFIIRAGRPLPPLILPIVVTQFSFSSRRISRLALRSVIPISAASCAEVIT